jgi:hypothetical protein
MAAPASSRSRRSRKPVSRRRRLITRLVVLAVILIGTGLAVWQVGAMTGIWRNWQIRQASSAWQRQKDITSVRSDIADEMGRLADALDEGRIERALDWIHPERRDWYRSQLAADPVRAGELADALRSVQLTFLSTDTGNYESERMAQIAIKLPPRTGAEGLDQPVTLTLVTYEDRWVIDS